jgi:hypothetical protein
MKLPFDSRTSKSGYGIDWGRMKRYYIAWWIMCAVVAVCIVLYLVQGK